MVKICRLKFSSHSSLSVNSFVSKTISKSNLTLIDNLDIDQSTINLNGFSVFTCTGIHFDVGGGTSDMKTTILLEPMNNAYALTILCDGTRAVS